MPALGEPVQKVAPARMTRRVALLADDYVGVRPSMRVAVGDDVKRGQLLFEDKKRRVYGSRRRLPARCRRFIGATAAGSGRSSSSSAARSAKGAATTRPLSRRSRVGIRAD